MTEEDRTHWDERHRQAEPGAQDAGGLPRLFASHEHLFPTQGQAVDIGCGPGRGAVWLARRGLDVWGLDISQVAVGQARDLAERSGVADRCRFNVVDLDGGLPGSPLADVVLCHMFRDRRLDRAIIERLAPGGLLAIAVLSEVDAAPGPFRVRPGELHAAFAELAFMAAGEGGGVAWLMGRR